MFKVPQDMRYIRFLKAIHSQMVFDWYMEVGCRNGRSLEHVRGKTVAVDPFFLITANVIREKPALLVLQQTSDDFFESGFLKSLGVELSFSFLDGMHLMEFLLRDFIHTERNSKRGGVIALHDCCPFNHEMTTRNVDDAPSDAWTGDVWKLIPILQKYRPDLKIDILGCRPTGLVMVHNLSPESDVLAEHYDEILADWQHLTLEEYGVDTFYNAFDYVPVGDVVDGDYQMFKDVRLSPETVPKPEFRSP